MNKKIVRRILSLVLICIIAFIGCKPQTVATETDMIPISEYEQGVEEEEFPEVLLDADGNVLYNSMSDEALLDYIETDLYEKIVDELNSDDYLVESVSAKYVSQEYIDELEYNSKPNVYFGYTLAELDESFQGSRYIFTLGDNGETIVEEFKEYDDTYEKVITNVAIGSGVILVCVVVSIVTGGVADAVAAPAVSVIFATAAKTGTVIALSDGILSGVVCGSLEGIKSGDVEKAVKTGLLEGSKSFKWGAIVGAVAGGVGKAASLYNFTLNGLTMNEAAILQSKEKVPENVLIKLKSMDEYTEIVEEAKNGGPTIEEISKILKETDCPFELAKKIKSVDEYYKLVEAARNGTLTIEEFANLCDKTKYPLELVKLFKSPEEAAIYFEEANLYAETVNGQAALVRTIDLEYKSFVAGKEYTNLERMLMGYAPIDPATGKAYELHHIGQQVDSPLAILTWAEHRSTGNNGILHDMNIKDGEGVHALMTDAEWTTQREGFWKAFGEMLK